MDDFRRQALQAELDEVSKEMERLTVVQSYLRTKLGLPEATTVSGAAVLSGAGSISASGSAVDDPSSQVAVGEFIGFSSTKAAEAMLQRMVRRPLKTVDLHRGVTKGGVKVKNSSYLFRNLDRDKRFQRVGKGLWGLSSWYETSKPKPAKEQIEDADTNEPSQNQERPDEEVA
jgi:hypothetical protein